MAPCRLMLHTHDAYSSISIPSFDRNPKTFHTSLLVLSAALIFIGGLRPLPLLSHSDLDNFIYKDVMWKKKLLVSTCW